MKYNQKLFLLAFIPVLITMLLTILLINKETQSLSAKQAQILRQSLLEMRQNELINYTSMAFSAVDHLYADDNIDQEFAKERVAEILTDLSYSQDGYFYAYDSQGTNVVHPKQPYRIGVNYWDLQDIEGKYVIQELINKAEKGGGFTSYSWEKPSINSTAKKIGYSRMLERWNWMVGTGVYTDDVAVQVKSLEATLGSHLESTSIKILIMALIASALVFLVGMFMQFNERKLADAKLQELTKRVINTQDEERRRVSRELHDGISQSLVGVKFCLEEAASLFRNKESRHAELIDKSNEQLQIMMQDVRRISRDLHPSVLDDFGLMAAVESLLNELSKRSNIKVSLTKVKVRNILPQDVKVALYRVTQEALNNIEKHSGASKVDIEFKVSADWFAVYISDNGSGFDLGSKKLNKNPVFGIGLRNMAERLSYFKGKFEIQSNDKGTSITAAIPKSLLGAQMNNDS